MGFAGLQYELKAFSSQTMDVQPLKIHIAASELSAPKLRKKVLMEAGFMLPNAVTKTNHGNSEPTARGSNPDLFSWKSLKGVII